MKMVSYVIRPVNHFRTKQTNISLLSNDIATKNMTEDDPKQPKW